MFAFVNRQRALAEIERRRGDIHTYTAPLENAPEDMRDFLMDFYRNIIFKRELQQEQLAQHPNTVGKFHHELVASKKIQSEEFWQRYYYRTGSVERVQNELLATDVVKRQQRSEALQSALQSGMQTAQSIMAKVDVSGSSKKEQDGDSIIFASREGDDESEEYAVVEEVTTLPTANRDTDETHEDQQQQQMLRTSAVVEDLPVPSSFDTPTKDSPPLVTPRTEKKLLLVNDMAFATSTPLPPTTEEVQQNPISSTTTKEQVTHIIPSQPDLSTPDKASTPTNSSDCDEDVPMVTPGTETKLNVVNALSFAPLLPTAVKKKEEKSKEETDDNNKHVSTPFTAMSVQAPIDTVPAVSSKNEKALTDVERQHSLFYLHSALMAILASIIVGVLLAQKSDWTTSIGDGLCAPIFPYQKLDNLQEVEGTAPWWVPSLGDNDLALKQNVFEWVCDGGDAGRVPTRLSWTPAKTPKDGFRLTITALDASKDDGSKKKKYKRNDLLTVKRLTAAHVFASQLELVSTKTINEREIVIAPWAKKSR